MIWLMIILKVAGNQGFFISLKKGLLEKPEAGSNWPSSLFRLNYEILILMFYSSKYTIKPLLIIFQKKSECIRDYGRKYLTVTLVNEKDKHELKFYLKNLSDLLR